jgi:3-oxoacyl-[acyl-carrier protein] reductase
MTEATPTTTAPSGSSDPPTGRVVNSLPRPVPPPPGGHGLLTGKIVVITAAAGTGIGFATAQRCVEEGATVVISDAHERRLGEAADALAQLPGSAGVRPLAVPCNVTDEVQVQRLYDAAVERHGRFDVAVNNAGLGGQVEVVEMTDEQWALVLDVTLTGTFRCTRAALRHFYGRDGGGVIVNNASVLGWRAQFGQSHYAAAKAGVMALTRCSAVEAAPHGVRVNAVSPSLAVHPFLNKVMADEELEELSRRELLGRGAEVWEVANVITFLASEYATFMTGEVVSVSSQHP